MPYSKGISPLLATVLLIATTVVVSTMVAGWLSSTTSATQTTVANRTSEGVACAAAEIIIDDVYSGAGSASVARAIVRNSGGSDNLAITSAQLYDKFGNNFTSVSSLPVNLNKGQMATLNFNYSIMSTTTNDSAHGINNGTLLNGTSYTLDGKYGSAYRSDGISYLIEIPNSPSLNSTDNLTVEAWFKAKSFQAETWKDNIVSKEIPGPVGGWVLLAGNGQPGFNTWSTAGNGDAARAGNAILNTGQWYHIVGIYNTTHRSIYVDGILINATAVTEARSANWGNVSIGGDLYLSRQRLVNGTIDDVAIWNRSLTNAEINTSMNYGPSYVGYSSDLMGYWKLDEGKGMLTCPDDFSRVVVTTNCGGVSAEFSKRTKC